MSKKVVIIGAGVGGLATACVLAQAGYDVNVYEKNSQAGGRAGSFKAKGFRFDTGPSWYLMPDIFEQFFSLLGEDVNELLKLKRLKPSYRVFFKDKLFGAVDIVGDLEKDSETLEALEPGAAAKLRPYLAKAEVQYALATSQFLYKNSDSLSDFMTPAMIARGLKMNVFTSMYNYVAKSFSSPEVQKILQYPMVFLGANPRNAPAMYSMMSHVDFDQGVFYPKGGMYELVEVLINLAKARGAKIFLNSPVKSIKVSGSSAREIILENGQTVEADIIVSNADIFHTEKKLLPPSARSYDNKYWQKRTLAPSALLMFLGVKKKFPRLKHHNMVFSKNWDASFEAIFKTKKWPSDPSFYVCNPNKTDKTTAPKDHENLFVLVPLPATTKYSQDELEKYSDWVLDTMEKTMHLDGLKENIVYKKLYAAQDFKKDFNSLNGTALGLAHTLKQTAVFRPSNKSKKLNNLYYVGANTVPGIGLPMCLISAQLVYKRLVGDKDNHPLRTLK